MLYYNNLVSVQSLFEKIVSTVNLALCHTDKYVLVATRQKVSNLGYAKI